MSPQEIRDYINTQYKLLESIDTTTFVLNTKVMDINNEISKYQKECKHEFVNGVCKWCDMEEE